MSKDKKTPTAARSLKLLPPEKKANESTPLNGQRQHAWIKTGICYNLNNCAADEFKILQSYLLVENKALDYYSTRLSLSQLKLHPALASSVLQNAGAATKTERFAAVRIKIEA